MIRYLCNACKREISVEEASASYIVGREWGVAFKEYIGTQLTDGVDDIFCPDHLIYAPDYWTDKVIVLEKMNKTMSSTLRNHCKEFFKRAMNESTGLHREVDKVAS